MTWELKCECSIQTSHPSASTVKSSWAQAGWLIHCKLVNMCSHPSHWLCMELVWSSTTSSFRCRHAASRADWHLALSHHSTDAEQSWAGGSCSRFRCPNRTTWVVLCVCVWPHTRGYMGSQDVLPSSGNNSFITSSTPYFPGKPSLLLAWTLELAVPQAPQQRSGVGTKSRRIFCLRMSWFWIWMLGLNKSKS